MQSANGKPSSFCLQERNLQTPLLIGGATTSKMHTAVKIEPQYKGATSIKSYVYVTILFLPMLSQAFRVSASPALSLT